MLRDRKNQTRPSPSTLGFSLIEMVIALGIMVIVLGVVVEGIAQMMRRNTAEGSKVDTVQVTRDFVDQMVRDIHGVGYPPARVLNGNPPCGGRADIACGVIYFSPTQIQYEGDLDGTGVVYQVWMQLKPPASGSCPCTLQRGVVTKAAALGGKTPDYFTEVDGVLNSGGTYPVALPGMGSYSTYASEDVFDAYDVNATPVPPCVDVATCSSIRSLQINVNVAPNFADPTTHTFPVYSITSKARLNNSWNN
jgi:type II secretory pathway pseudopilin PulG